MISSVHHLSRSAANYCLRSSAVSSVTQFRSFSLGFGGNTGFAPVSDPPAPKDKGPVLTKADLAQIISAEHGLKMAESNRILNTLLDTIVEVRALLCSNTGYFFLTFIHTCHVQHVRSFFHSSNRRCPKRALFQSLALENLPAKN